MQFTPEFSQHWSCKFVSLQKGGETDVNKMQNSSLAEFAVFLIFEPPKKPVSDGCISKLLVYVCQILVLSVCAMSMFVKVHLTPKYFFHSNKSLHLFETHCAFFKCPFLTQILTFYRL